MTIEVTTLGNGLRIVSHTMPHLETVSLGVWVASGSRNERDDEQGISHLLEHMAFKGTSRRDARAIAEEIEQVGGELNAATSAEMTAYYARVLKTDIGTPLDILADILQDPLFKESELEREREVILQEIAGTRDSPDDMVYDLAQDAAYPDQPLGRPILGTARSVTEITPKHLTAYLKQHYRAPRMVLSAAGGVDHVALVRHAEALFGGLHAGGADLPERGQYKGGTRASSKPFEQSHLLLGLEGPSYRIPEYYTAQVFSGLFGGGMSSRLFQEVRERRGLCYAIYSFAWGFTDTGFFGIHAATGAEQMGELVDVVAREIRKAAEAVPSAAELARAKAQLKVGLAMSLESSSARAEQMARQLLVFDRLIGPEELIGRVEAVTAEAVRGFAERLVASRALTYAEVGTGARSARSGEAAAALGWA